MKQLLDFEYNRESIKSAYYLIGVLELRLRHIIPVTLSSLSKEGASEAWSRNLNLSEKGFQTLNRAKVLNPEFPQEFLPFSFWRYLLSSKHYGSLWIPKLYSVFPGMSAPKSRNSFLQIDKAMDTALRLRNQVAHYNLRNYRGFQYSQSKIEWLIELMDTNEVS
jgi:hypothetical protein